MKNRLIAFLSLFTSSGTLICCAIPALLVTVGLGATMAGLIAQFPQLVWLSEQKNYIFAVGAVLLSVSGWLQWRVRKTNCEVGTIECRTTRDWTRPLFFLSLSMYLIGFTVAFVLPFIP